MENVKVVKKKTEKMDEVFDTALAEIKAVLDRTKAITDVTKLAANMLSNYSKIYASEVHDRGLDIIEQRLRAKQISEK